MASAKSKSAAVNGASKKAKSAATPSTTANGTPAISAVDLPSEQPAVSAYGSGKPDRAIYDAEQAKIQAEIDALQTKLVRVCIRLHVTQMSSVSLTPGKHFCFTVCSEGKDCASRRGKDRPCQRQKKRSSRRA